MAITNSYTVNSEVSKPIDAEAANIDMSKEEGVKAGCDKFPIPVLNKITVTSRDGALFKSTTIYAGYKIVNQMLGALVHAGDYNPNKPFLNTIISSCRFGIFEPAHYNTSTRTWAIYRLKPAQIVSLINLGTGIKICFKIDYVRSSSSPATAYVDVPGVASIKIAKTDDVAVPYYGEIGTINLAAAETVDSGDVENAERRAWFEVILSSDDLNINLNSYITDPKTTEDMTITLMAYIGSNPTADNAFPILPMNSKSTTSVVVKFETYNPTISISNKDTINNPDSYSDGYGSVADYDTGSSNDTTISISIVAP